VGGLGPNFVVAGSACAAMLKAEFEISPQTAPICIAALGKGGTCEGGMTVGALRAVMASIWETLAKDLVVPYRPEKNYMRGPGAKCREMEDEVLVRAKSEAGSGRSTRRRGRAT
jgi:hypothetical protein